VAVAIPYYRVIAFIVGGSAMLAFLLLLANFAGK
jgi:hypothetical protein